MSSIILDKTISVSRLSKDVDNSDKESYVANLALQSVKCEIQPATPEQTVIANGVFGQTFICFTTSSGILDGDKVVDDATQRVFRVKGIEDWSMDPIPHYEIMLLEFEEEKV